MHGWHSLFFFVDWKYCLDKKDNLSGLVLLHENSRTDTPTEQIIDLWKCW